MNQGLSVAARHEKTGIRQLLLLGTKYYLNSSAPNQGGKSVVRLSGLAVEYFLVPQVSHGRISLKVSIVKFVYVWVFWLCKGKRGSQKDTATELSLITSECRGLMDIALLLVSSVE